jgi:pimeloyl-ACP methyl ester carboxylesterase
MAATPQTETIQAPGATLYYEVRGSGPLLLMIAGGPSDADAFGGLATALADRYRTVSYDPRGNSRSMIEDADRDQDMDRHADDAALLLTELSDEPAYVLGSSGGGQIALNLAARHPKLVRTLVAHEAPAVSLLPDAAEAHAGFREVVALYRSSGMGPAVERFQKVLGMSQPPTKEENEEPPPSETFIRNLSYFFEHGVGPISTFVPDIEALRSGPVRIVPAIGAESAGQLPNRTAIALAERLGVEPVTFPGDHGGYGAHPAAFGGKLHEVLRG